MSQNSTKLMSLLFLIGRQMRDTMRHKTQKGSGSWLQLEVLRYVNENGKTPMRAVAAHFSITPPAATLLVDGLVANNMLRRTVDKKDRRTVRVILTPKGKRMLKQGMQKRIATIKRVFSVLDAKEHAELTRILEKIAKSK